MTTNEAQRMADTLELLAAFLRTNEPPIIYVAINVHDSGRPNTVSIQVSHDKDRLPGRIAVWAELLHTDVRVTEMPNSKDYLRCYDVHGTVGTQPVHVFGYIDRVPVQVPA